jgi:hypothetical protein
LPSSHDVPIGFCGFEHTPVHGSHVPASWHWSLAMHVIGFAPSHPRPGWQVSVCVQASPSSHAVPLGFSWFEHAPVAGTQASSVQGLLSSQVTVV